jgi:hypothetical protein
MTRAKIFDMCFALTEILIINVLYVFCSQLVIVALVSTKNRGVALADFVELSLILFTCPFLICTILLACSIAVLGFGYFKKIKNFI